MQNFEINLLLIKNEYNKYYILMQSFTPFVCAPYLQLPEGFINSKHELCK